MINSSRPLLLLLVLLAIATGCREKTIRGASGVYRSGDILLIAGDKDDLVPIQHSRKIHAAFQEAKVASKLIEVAGAGHGFQGEDARTATEAMVQWFETQLTAER